MAARAVAPSTPPASPTLTTAAVAPAVRAAAIHTTTAANAPTKQRQAPVKTVDRRPLSQPPASKGHYAVQVASFKMRKDAEHMKGMLTLKGFDVHVVPVSHAQGNWFRVVVGPYSNRDSAQKAQLSLARNERLRGMLVSVS